MELTKERVKAEQKALDMAGNFIFDDKFDSNEFDKNYNKGLTPDNVHFGYQFAHTCANMLTMKSEAEIRQKTPALLKVLSRLNDSEFAFGLDCFKNRMNMYNPYFSQDRKFFDQLIKESIENTELANHKLIQNITQKNTEKVIDNISSMRESSVATSENKLKNK
jgi:hypothetical protein